MAASIAAAVAWSLISYGTGYQIGFMAIGVGFLVGFAVNRFGKGVTAPFGIIGGFFALFGCLLGNLLTVAVAASQLEGASISLILIGLLGSPNVVVEVMTESFSPIDLLFYGIAIYEGYRLSFRKLTEEETASLVKVPVGTQPSNPV